MANKEKADSIKEILRDTNVLDFVEIVANVMLVRACEHISLETDVLSDIVKASKTKETIYTALGKQALMMLAWRHSNEDR
jgi:hypothetical protein